MGDKTITLSEAELQERIDTSVKEATESLAKTHATEMYELRQKHKTELEKVKKNADLSVEERAKLEAEEKQKEYQNELNELRAYKKSTELEKRLTKEGLPTYFKNDTRLLSADEEQFEKVLSGVKKEYESTLPKGNTHSSVVRTATGKPQVDAKQDAYNKMGEALKGILR